jgi:hypothetical protein
LVVVRIEERGRGQDGKDGRVEDERREVKDCEEKKKRVIRRIQSMRRTFGARYFLELDTTYPDLEAFGSLTRSCGRVNRKLADFFAKPT